MAYVGSLFLMMSFVSPYWIESYSESFSSFKNMGLWEYCFKDFYYPYYQFPRKFNGCHNIFSHVSSIDGWILIEMYIDGHILTFIFNYIYSGILRDSWIFGTRMAADRPSQSNHWIYFNICGFGNFGPGTRSMAVENCPTIWIRHDQSGILLLINCK